MDTVHFRFGRYLDSMEFMVGLQPTHGPLFTRWLPDGERDAFPIPTGDQDAEVRVWFSRRGYAEGNKIHYDVERKEIDPALLKFNSRLEAGPLFGLLIVKDVSLPESQALQAGKTDDPCYVKLGKRLVTLITCAIRKLVRILKVNYGQYWLADLEDWDSRFEPLDSFCCGLFLRWSLDGADNWNDFWPNRVHVIRGQWSLRTDYSCYLEEKDWPELASLCASGYEPTLAGELLSHAHRLLDQGQLKYAIVEGVSALEVSLIEYVKTKFTGKAREIAISVAEAGNLRRLPLRTALIAGMISGIEKADLESALTIIEERNAIVHEGKNPPSNLTVHLQGLLKVVAGVLQVGRFKFPILNAGNSVRSPHDDFVGKEKGTS